MIFVAPETGPIGPEPRIFLAGSIEQGAAIDWQDTVAQQLTHKANIFNPRRKTWNSTLVQSADNPQFAEQVNWELDNIDKANIVLFFFDPKTKSSITLLELGYVVNQPGKHIIVACPQGYWRRGNIEVLAARKNFILVEDLGRAVELTLEILGNR